MKIKKYDGSNKLTRKNIISVAKDFYDGLTYDKEYAPAGWDFEPGARLVDLKTGIKKGEDFFEDELSQFDRWQEKNAEIFHIAGNKMKENELNFLDVIFLPTTYEGSVEYYDCATHWKPTLCAVDKDFMRYVFEEDTKKWYLLKVEQEEYDVPCGICDWGTAYGMGAFVRFLRGLILVF